MPFSIAAICLVLSGIAALVYQVAWVRLLALAMGSTSASVSTVVAAFFLGLAGGSWAAGELSARFSAPRAYVALEAAIGLAGLALLPLLLAMDQILAAMPAVAVGIAGKFAIAIGLLALPTFAMGATFPVMTAVILHERVAEDATGRRISELYSLNTLGAVLGALLSGFVLIPRVGLDGAVYAAAALNGAIVLIAGWSVRRREQRGRTREPAAVEMNVTPSPPPVDSRSALFVLIVTGFSSIAAEVGWTKYLSILTGTTIYGFSVILAVFLAGIALGSWAVRLRIARIERPGLTLATGLLALAAATLLTRGGLSVAPALHSALVGLSWSPELGRVAVYAYVAMVLLPSTLLLGAMFPLALGSYCGTAVQARARVGRGYAANTVAGIVGSAGAGLWLIPRYGTDRLLLGLGLLLASCGLLLAYHYGSRWNRVTAAVAAAAVAAAGILGPGIDYRTLIDAVDDRYDQPTAAAAPSSRSLFLREGRMGVISVTTRDGASAGLQSNGLTESHIDLVDPRNGSLIEGLLGLLPYFVHADPQHAFVVGFGGGNTVYALSTAFLLRTIDVVELEPAIVEAVRTVSAENVPALQDPRVTLTIGDARHALLTTARRYQIIASQPSHPWLAGASSLFTREFFVIVRSRLTGDGVFAQWLNLFRMDTTTLRAILKSFCEVFPHALSFADLGTGDLLLLGSSAPIQLDPARMRERMRVPATARYLMRHRIGEPADLLKMFALSRAEMVRTTGDSRPSTDTNLIPEVRLAAARSRPVSDEDPYLWLRRHRSFDLVGYVAGPEQAQLLYGVGLELLEQARTDDAHVVLEHLARSDPGLAERLASAIDAQH